MERIIVKNRWLMIDCRDDNTSWTENAVNLRALSQGNLVLPWWVALFMYPVFDCLRKITSVLMVKVGWRIWFNSVPKHQAALYLEIEKFLLQLKKPQEPRTRKYKPESPWWGWWDGGGGEVFTWQCMPQKWTHVFSPLSVFLVSQLYQNFPLWWFCNFVFLWFQYSLSLTEEWQSLNPETTEEVRVLPTHPPGNR